MPKKRYAAAIPVSHNPNYATQLVGQWLATKAPVIGVLDILPPELGDEKYLVFGVGSKSQINGRLFDFGDSTAASIECFNVFHKLQGHGIGERLFKGYLAACRDNDATGLWSDSVSNMAIGLRAKILGAEALHFYDNEYPDRGFLPYTIDQARATNSRIDELDRVDSERPAPQGHIGIYVDLTILDMAGWEAPELIRIRD